VIEHEVGHFMRQREALLALAVLGVIEEHPHSCPRHHAPMELAGEVGHLVTYAPPLEPVPHSIGGKACQWHHGDRKPEQDLGGQIPGKLAWRRQSAGLHGFLQQPASCHEFVSSSLE
jgi:hypothetical protein